MFTDTETRRGRFQDHRCSLQGVGLVALAAAFAAALPATAAAAPGDATMFVQSAESGQLGGGRLVLGGVSGRVSWATNSGRSGVVSVRRLHQRLIRPGKPATGTLHIAGQRGGHELSFRLSRPRYSPARHTVAYRAKPLRGRRGARAAGFRPPRRFGPASLSIIPHPTLMGGPSCTATIMNNTNYTLDALGGQFERYVTDNWNPMWPNTIAAGKSATWASDGVAPVGCWNSGIFRLGGTRVNVEFMVCVPGSSSECKGSNTQYCKIALMPLSGPPPATFSCTLTSQSGGTVAWTVGQG